MTVGSRDTREDTSSHWPDVGTHILGHLRLEQLVARSADSILYLAHDNERSEPVLVAMATSEEALARCLSEQAGGQTVKKTTLGSWHIAEVTIDKTYPQRFADQLIDPLVDASTLEPIRETTSAYLAHGSVFAERYRIDGILGRGGMGEVYRAHDDTFQRDVPLKIVRVDADGDNRGRLEEAKRRLLNEARVVSALKHPHIVEIHDAGESDGLPYLVLELCDGGNLRKVMGENVSQAERVRWLVEIAEALAYAHDQGIIHRDIKPENIILTKDRCAKVADFGIAKAFKGGGIGSSTA